MRAKEMQERCLDAVNKSATPSEALAQVLAIQAKYVAKQQATEEEMANYIVIDPDGVIALQLGPWARVFNDTGEPQAGTTTECAEDLVAWFGDHTALNWSKHIERARYPRWNDFDVEIDLEEFSSPLALCDELDDRKQHALASAIRSVLNR